MPGPRLLLTGPPRASLRTWRSSGRWPGKTRDSAERRRSGSHPHRWLANRSLEPSRCRIAAPVSRPLMSGAGTKCGPESGPPRWICLPRDSRPLGSALPWPKRSSGRARPTCLVHWPLRSLSQVIPAAILTRFEAWIRGERRPEGPAPGPGPVESAEWALFRHFSETLDDIAARTPAGWAVWASRLLAATPPAGWRNLDDTLIVVVEPVAPSRAIRRALDDMHRRAGAMIVTLPYDPEPTLGEVYAAVEPTRRYFLSAGFVPEEIAPDSAELTEIERELFRTDAHLRPPLRGQRFAGARGSSGRRSSSAGRPPGPGSFAGRDTTRRDPRPCPSARTTMSP